jgi:hypothetical protein
LLRVLSQDVVDFRDLARVLAKDRVRVWQFSEVIRIFPWEMVGVVGDESPAIIMPPAESATSA